MTHRVVRWDIASLILFSVLSFIPVGFGSEISHVSIYVVLGWVFGFVSGATFALTDVSSLSKYGEVRSTRRKKTCLVVSMVSYAIIAVLTFLYLPPTIGPSLMSSTLAAIFGARAIFYHNWEKKHKKPIVVNGFWSTRFFALPETEETHEITESLAE